MTGECLFVTIESCRENEIFYMICHQIDGSNLAPCDLDVQHSTCLIYWELLLEVKGVAPVNALKLDAKCSNILNNLSRKYREIVSSRFQVVKMSAICSLKKIMAVRRSAKCLDGSEVRLMESWYFHFIDFNLFKLHLKTFFSIQDFPLRNSRAVQRLRI